jgi:allantoinase
MRRDLVGYGQDIPVISWPGKAQIAVNFILNYEEGSEQNILDGDEKSESYLTDLPSIVSLNNKRHLIAESLFEYGSRAGLWRLLNLFDQHKIPLTLFATGLALERNPQLAQFLKKSQHEVVGHGYRWIDYKDVDENIEKSHIAKTLEVIQDLTGKKVKGWYTGRCSQNTRKLIIEAGLIYDSDSYADDLPYWVMESDKQHLVIPYSLETNDARYTMSPGWNTGEDGFLQLKSAFDCLFHEGINHPKMLSIGLHPRLSGRPSRSWALQRFINYILQFEKVWVCRREDIAMHWMTHYPILQETS